MFTLFWSNHVLTNSFFQNTHKTFTMVRGFIQISVLNHRVVLHSKGDQTILVSWQHHLSHNNFIYLVLHMKLTWPINWVHNELDIMFVFTKICLYLDLCIVSCFLVWKNKNLVRVLVKISVSNHKLVLHCKGCQTILVSKNCHVALK